MPMLANVEIHFIRLDPKRPNAKLNKSNPTWEIQMRTNSIEQKEEWAEVGLTPKLMKYKDGDPKEGELILTEDGKKQWACSMRKKSIKADKSPMPPVEVVDGNLDPVDPNTVAAGSVANIRFITYPYKDKNEKDATGFSLMGIQLIKHIVYAGGQREDFDKTETTRITPPPKEEGDSSGSSSAPSAPPKDVKPEDQF